MENFDEACVDTMMAAVPLPRLYERDIDVILREELLFSRAVLQVVVRALGLPSDTSVLSGSLSVVDGTGETDVFIQIESSAGPATLLIENKIDAAFQPSQPERYALRSTSLAGSQRAAYTMLVSPRRYNVSQADRKHFNAIVSYEDVAEAMRLDGTERSRDRAGLLLRAVEQSRSAYVVVPDADVTAFYQRIYAITSATHPHLKMKPPRQKGSQSSWHIFKGELPANVAVDWKIKSGTVGLSFWRNAFIRPASGTDLSALGETARWRQEGQTIIIEKQSIVPPAHNWTQLSDEEIGLVLEDVTLMMRFFDLLTP